MKPELDLFTVRGIQNSVLRTEEISYRPVNSLVSASILEFNVPAVNEMYKDLSSVYLRLKVRLMKDANDALHTDAKVGVVNNIIHSLFKQCAVFFNGKQISQNPGNYGYRCYIENLLNYGAESAQTHLDGSGWAIDTPGQLDELADKKNLGLDARKALFAKSCLVELESKIHADMFNNQRYLINGVDMRLVLSLENANFYVMAEDADKSYMKIEEATLYVNHCTINPNILLAHHKLLQTKPINYPYKRVEVKSYTVGSGSLTVSLDNIIMGQLPNLILFAMVDNKAYTGQRSKNGFNFQHFNCTSISFSCNGYKYPTDGLEMDFFSNKDAPISTRAYQSLFKSTNLHHFDRNLQITKNLFNNGCFIIGCDLTPDLSSDMCSNLLGSGTVRVDLRFAEALKQTITVIIYSEYTSELLVDSNLNVFTT